MPAHPSFQNKPIKHISPRAMLNQTPYLYWRTHSGPGPNNCRCQVQGSKCKSPISRSSGTRSFSPGSRLAQGCEARLGGHFQSQRGKPRTFSPGEIANTTRRPCRALPGRAGHYQRHHRHIANEGRGHSQIL